MDRVLMVAAVAVVVALATLVACWVHAACQLARRVRSMPARDPRLGSRIGGVIPTEPWPRSAGSLGAGDACVTERRARLARLQRDANDAPGYVVIGCFTVLGTIAAVLWLW
jgi:hypothetical protein